MKEFLKSIGIENPGHYTDDEEYVIDIEDSNEYSRVFSKLDKSTKIHEVEDDSVFDLEKNILYFEAEDYDIELSADLDEDKYSLKISKKTEE